jgi:glutamate 5-kinase
VQFAEAVQGIAEARRRGWSVVLVSSGAAALGGALLARRSAGDTKSVPDGSRHFRSAIGQPELMSLYRVLGDACQVPVCQILLSVVDLQDPNRSQRAANVIHETLSAGYLPVVNGNDSTDKDVYDNDRLAVSIAVACRAQRLVFLTDVTGVYSSSVPGAPILDELTPDTIPVMPRDGGAGYGTGGMRSKVRCAALAAHHGVTAHIAKAGDAQVIVDVS